MKGVIILGVAAPTVPTAPGWSAHYSTPAWRGLSIRRAWEALVARGTTRPGIRLIFVTHSIPC